MKAETFDTGPYILELDPHGYADFRRDMQKSEPTEIMKRAAELHKAIQKSKAQPHD